MSYVTCFKCGGDANRIAELEAACKLENELKTAGSLRELKLMGEVDELRKQLADLRGEVNMRTHAFRVIDSMPPPNESTPAVIKASYERCKSIAATYASTEYAALAAQSAREKI